MRTEDFMDVKGLAEYLGRSVSGIYNLRHRGDGPPAIKIGSQLRFRVADVERWLDEHSDQRVRPSD